MRLIYRRIQGLLWNAGPNSLEDLVPYAEQNADKVGLTSPLAFLFVASDQYLAFKNHNEDARIIQMEIISSAVKYLRV